MEYLQSVTLFSVPFTLWMLYDAYHRQVEPMWYWLILLMQPVGGFGLLFHLQVAGLLRRSCWPFGSRRPSLDELRYRVEQMPTLTARLELAESLIEHGLHAEAIAPLEAALKVEPENCQLLYLLALCFTEQGHPDQAFPLWAHRTRDRARSDYSARRLLVAAKAQHGDSPGALAVCRELARLSPTLQHRCLLVERLIADGLTEEAHTVLEESLADHHYAPAPVRRRNRRWASHARHLRKRIRTASKIH